MYIRCIPQIREKYFDRFSILGNNLHPCCLEISCFRLSISFREINLQKPVYFSNQFSYSATRVKLKLILFQFNTTNSYIFCWSYNCLLYRLFVGRQLKLTFIVKYLQLMISYDKLQNSIVSLSKPNIKLWININKITASAA